MWGSVGDEFAVIEGLFRGGFVTYGGSGRSTGGMGPDGAGNGSG
jgi:hypothetical protein